MPISVERLTVYDPEGRHPLLHDLSCQIADGQITLLLGKTGAGKTTFLDALAGLTPLHSGAIVYDQRPLWQGKRLDPALQLACGNVFQYPEHQLFAQTVQGEFAYSLRPLKLPRSEQQARTLTALTAMGLPTQMLTEAPLTLSEGQKRRVALASTFATQPTWLFLDEPTAGLDPATSQRLLAYLQAWKQHERGGVVIATHDLDTLLPIADRVIVLHAGRIVASLTPQELCAQPELLRTAEIGVPSTIELFLLLRALDLPLTHVPPSPQQCAESILHGYYKRAEATAALNDPLRGNGSSVPEPVAQLPPPLATPPASDLATGFAQQLDPRAKWLFYILVSLGVFMQQSWVGLLLATLITCATVLIAQVPLRGIVAAAKSFALLIVISMLFSGVRFSPVPGALDLGFIHFALQPASITFMQLYKILLILVLGVVFTVTTSQISMKRALEQFLAGLRRWRVPVETFALATSLILRFIPLIMQESLRFSRITRARGKRNTRPGSVALRDVSALVIPLILAVLRLGSDLALAMEARGYTPNAMRRTSSSDQPLRRVDRQVMVAGLLLLLGLAAIALGVR